MQEDIITLAHGGGGTLTRRIVEEIILRELGNPILRTLDDGACLQVPESELVLTTDSYVVDPIFFPGGDIGVLAVCGTLNDLAMQGAEPRYLTLGLILEEGLAFDDLRRVIASAGKVCRENGVLVVTGDTKVVERRGRVRIRRDGRSGGDSGLFMNTTGLGVRRPGADVSVGNARPGDVILVSGSIGDHGMAVMNAREDLGLESGLASDVAPLWRMIAPLLDAVPSVHCLRDPTRGGVAAALCDIAERSGCGVRLREEALPVREPVRGACDILGIDVLNVANEGKAIIVCAPEDAPAALAALQDHPLGRAACVIGRAVPEHRGIVVMETRAGGERIVTVPSGEDLPRIC